MNKVHKIIFRISLCFIILCVLTIFLPIEITNGTVKMNFTWIRLFGIPIAVLLTLTGIIKQKDTILIVIVKSVVTTIFAGFTCFFLIILLFVNMCEWTESEVFFTHKQKPNTKIVERSMNCGAFDTDFPNYKPFKITKLSDNFIWAVKVDTTNLDTNKWEKVVNTKIAE